MTRWRSLAAAAAWLVSLPAAAATEVQFWHAMDGVSGEVLQRLVERFNASQAEAKVILTRHGDHAAMLRAGMAAAQSGAPPHVLQASASGTADLLANPRLIKPAHAVAAEWGMRFDREEYLPGIVGQYTDAAGRLLALPFNTSMPVMYVNRDAFAAAGVDPDRLPKTWHALQASLLDLKKGGASCPFTTTAPAWIHIENLSALHNQPLASHNNGVTGDHPELQFNSRLTIRHVSLLSAWTKSDLFRPASQGDDAGKRFERGECALLSASSAAYGDIVRDARFKVGILPLPHYDDFAGAPHSGLPGGAALWVMAGRPQREYREVARFLAYLASPAVAAEWHQATGHLPMSRAAYLATKNSGFYNQHRELEAGAAQLLAARPGPFARGARLRHYGEIRAIVEEELDAVWNGGKAPIDALEAAVARGNALLRPAAAPKR